jgi:hypothetical protein
MAKERLQDRAEGKFEKIKNKAFVLVPFVFIPSHNKSPFAISH